MKTLVTAKQMAAMDEKSIHEYGIPGIVLMENAGAGITHVAVDMLENPAGKVVHIYCGPGNNGGDGYVVARHLHNRHAIVHTYILSTRDKIKGDAEINLNILFKLGLPVHYIESIPMDDKPHLIIDAMLGTGVQGELRGLYAEMVTHINRQSVPVLSIDIPTGVNADTGDVADAVQANVTATMALLKRGLLFAPGRHYCGETRIVDISMPPAVEATETPHIFLYEKSDAAKILPKRQTDAYKNSCGTVAVLAGSIGFTGAAMLSSKSALRSGSGLVYLACPASLNAIYESALPEIITVPFPDKNSGRHSVFNRDEIFNLIRKQDVLALGPGLGQAPETVDLAHAVLKEIDKPLVLDADGLNACADHTDLIKNYPGELVITPHPGELARLLGTTTQDIFKDRIEFAKQTALELGCVLVLKGGPTVTAIPSGTVFVNSSGNAGMATAGSGDVLTGIISGLMAQGLSASDAALAGVYVHGLAGDYARQAKGEMGMIAQDILDHAPVALEELQNYHE